METQDLPAPVPIRLNRVGVKNIRKQVIRKRGEKENFLNVEIDAYIDLSSNHRGAHLSRNTEVINEVIERVASGTITDVEDMCMEIAFGLLNTNSDIARTEVQVRADYPVVRRTPKSRIKTQSIYKLLASASVEIKNGTKFVRRLIGVEVPGITACPCAQDELRARLEKHMNSEKTKKLLQTIPIATHNQRGVGTLTVELQQGYRVEADDLIQIVEDSMSGRQYDVLKREDEVEVVTEVHANPRFVEDSVRLMVSKLFDKYPDLPADAKIVARQINFESIHPYDVFAEKIGTAADLRTELEVLDND